MTEYEEAATEEVRYDPAANQRFEFIVRDGGRKFETAHVFGPLTDERWMKFLKDQRVRGDADQVETDEVEATAALWNDLCIDVENVTIAEGQKLSEAIDYFEKKEALGKLVAVAIVEPEETESGPRTLGGGRERVVVTEAFSGDRILQQRHVLRERTVEDLKRYESIMRRRFRQEPTKGLRRSARIEFVPQDDKIGKLYDDLLISVGGFAEARVPLRFKTLVIHHLFDSEIDEKK